jgi:hypothetical protein
MSYATQSRAHPRAGMAIGAAVVVGWLGAIGVAIASDDSPVAQSDTVTNAGAPESTTGGEWRVWPGYPLAGAD